MEPSYLLTNIVAVALPFGCYYFGILVRKVVFPGSDSPPLFHQLLLGVPISLAVVSPLLPVFAKVLSDIPALLVTLGVIMEHGMIVNETATQRIKKIAKSIG